MEKIKAIEILKDFNDYRRNVGAYDVDEPCEPKFKASEIGEAIDVAIDALIERDCSDMTVLDAVVAESGISLDALSGECRNRNLIIARCVAARMLRNDGFTLKEIGKMLHRTHAAILNLLEETDDWLVQPAYHNRELRLLNRVKKRIEGK